jgi:streptomycin 6-kinase
MTQNDQYLPPEWIRWLESEPGGKRWLRNLPSTVADCARRWELQLLDPFESHVSYVAPGRLVSGASVVLKINYPHRESEHEPHALSHWQGRGAVELVEAWPERNALLLERCNPGRMLWDEPEDYATEVMIGVFHNLWEKPAPEAPFKSLADEANSWSEHLAAAWLKAGKPFERELVDEAIEFMATAGGRSPDDVVLHQDLHGGNVLLNKGNWVVIDPKPIVGERAFDLASYIRDRRDELMDDEGAQETVRRRLNGLCSGLNVDVERARGWALAHALAWGFESDGEFLDGHVVAARLIANC